MCFTTQLLCNQLHSLGISCESVPCKNHGCGIDNIYGQSDYAPEELGTFIEKAAGDAVALGNLD